MNVQRFLSGGGVVIGTAIVILSAGCASPTSPEKSSVGANRTRPEVMDLNDSPPVAPPPPAAPVAPAAPAAPEPPAANAAPRKHVVAAKETLYSLAVKYYGDGKQWTKIRDANPGLVPERMPVGKAIVIP